MTNVRLLVSKKQSSVSGQQNQKIKEKATC